ncbi:MAG: hypothetical protein ACRC1P_02560 [Cellulosilyticaceae bacterium]
MEKNIVIEGKTNDWYEKAVFVLRDPKTTKVPNNLVSYAEELLERSLKTGNYISVNPHAEAYTKTIPLSKHKQVVRASGINNLRWIDDFFGISLGVLGIATIFYFLF